MNIDKKNAIIRQRVIASQANLKIFKGRDVVTDAEILRELSEIDSQQLKAGMLTRERLSRLNFEVDDYEILAGRILPTPRTEAENEKASAFLKTIPPHCGQSGHCAPSMDELFEFGIDGLIEKISVLHKKSDGEKADTYQSFIYALEGMRNMIKNAVKPLQAALKDASPERAAELEKMISSCKRIAKHPPANFRDAIQLVWFVVVGIMDGDQTGYICPGMLDRHFARFIETSATFRQEALELLEAYYFLLNDFTPSGGATAILVGGIDENGHDVTNELSYLCLEALRRTKLVYPTVGVCWHENTPEDIIDLAVELITKGYSTPAFFGNEVIRRGLMQYGVPEAEACDYQNSTCVEITPYGSSNIWVASPYFSLCGILMEHIGNITAGDSTVHSYEDFRINYFKLLGEKITKAVKDQNESRERRRLYNRNPLQSVLTRDCIERGRDIDDGGARYNWVECSFVGLANLVDSLKVIREEVFKTGNHTLPELKKILDDDFSGDEKLRQEFLNKYPKYGLDDPEVDTEIKRIMDCISKECAKHKMLPDDSHFVPGTFCWVMHQRLGAECGATPDGRRAGFPFADGAGPAQGREKFGPTAAINSVTSWDHSAMIGGSAFNMKFNNSVFTTLEAVEKLKQLILVFLRKGGFETQINVIDNSTLKDALVNPEQYRDLVVRIGGYTDYFTRLSPEMQQEVMQRTEYKSL